MSKTSVRNKKFKTRLKDNARKIESDNTIMLNNYRVAIDNLKDKRNIKEIRDILSDIGYIKCDEKLETSKVSDCMFDLFCTIIDEYSNTIHLEIC